MIEPSKQLSIDDELEDFGAWVRSLPASPLTRAERERIRGLIDQRRRELLRIPTTRANG